MNYNFLSNDINYSDFEAVKRRLVHIEATRIVHERREVQAKLRHGHRVKHSVPTPELVRAPLSNLESIINSYSVQTGIGCVLIAGMSGVFGILASGFVEGRTEAAFDARCRTNELNYVSRSRTFCADSQRFAHQLTEERFSNLPKIILGSIRKSY